MVADGGPVFIGGLDQSGKTPLRRLLEASPSFAFVRRIYLWTRVHERFGDLSDDRNLERCLTAVSAQPGLRAAGIDFDVVMDRIGHGPRTYGRLLAVIGEEIARAAGRPRWGAQEAGVEHHAAAVFREFPDARIVHMLRDPRDRHSAGAPAELLRTAQLGMATTRWRANARVALENQDQFANRYLVVRFEDLRTDAQGVAAKIARFLGDPAVDAVVAAARRAEGALAASMPAVERRTPSGPWSAGVLRLVEGHAAHELEAMGHRLTAEPAQRADRARYFALDLPLYRLGVAIEAVRGAVRRRGERTDPKRMERTS
jgi:hypothetical protein